MRNNQPVTNREVKLKDGAVLMSRTDPGGRIESYNQDFLEISGFDADELAGAPHNIVRHPDMPQDAFADLWRTVKAGLGKGSSRTDPRTATIIGSRPTSRR
jgi:PAS domain S-box-containing protein